MAVTCTSIKNDLDILADVIEGFNGITVTKISGGSSLSPETATLSLADVNDDVVCLISKKYGSGSALEITAYLNDDVYESATFPRTATGSTFASGINVAWKCANGIMIDLVSGYGTTSKYSYPFYIVKTNAGKTAFIFSTGSSQGTNTLFYTSLSCVAFGDEGTMDDLSAERYFSFTPCQRKTAVMASVPTRGAYGSPSYTYKSGIMLFNLEYVSGAKYGEVIMDGKYYLTNTYFSIEDE